MILKIWNYLEITFFEICDNFVFNNSTKNIKKNLNLTYNRKTLNS